MKKVRMHVTRSGTKIAEQPRSSTKAPPKEVTPADVFRFQRDQQHKLVLSGAEAVLDEVQTLVARLKAGAVPTTALNASTVVRLLTDHATLIALEDAVEVASKAK